MGIDGISASPPIMPPLAAIVAPPSDPEVTEEAKGSGKENGAVRKLNAEGGSHFEERQWTISLDADRCEGVFRCWEVCPEACFEKREEIRKVELAHDDRCIRCGACVVQCPKDALYFEDQNGARIEPETIRKFKLNLLGKRSVATLSSSDQP